MGHAQGTWCAEDEMKEILHICAQATFGLVSPKRKHEEKSKLQERAHSLKGNDKMVLVSLRQYINMNEDWV